MRNIIYSIAALVLCSSAAYADCCVTDTTAGFVVLSCGNCVTITPDESTLAAWAAKKAVNSQLDWFDKNKVAKLNREDLDAMQDRVQKLCGWTTTLSNHIFRDAYIDWVNNANSVIAARRLTLDQLDVAKSLVTGLPSPP